MVHLETDKTVKRVKFTKGTSMDGQWLGMLDNGRVVTLEKGFMEDKFPRRFIHECKELGDNKFVRIPIGSSRSSLMSIFPSLHCE